MSRRKDSAGVLEDATALAEANKIIKRLIEDTDLREAVGRAVESSRAVHDRISSAKKPSKLKDDATLQAEAMEAVEAVRAVAGAFGGSKQTGKSKSKRKGGGFGAKLLVLGAAGGVAMVASEGLRSKVLDALFGAEEEFEYSPPPPVTGDAPGSPLSAV